MIDERISMAMVEAGMAAAMEHLPAEIFDERSVDPAAFVMSVFRAMAREQWQPIHSAPRSGASVMLGLKTPTDFKVGIGMWVDAGDDSGTGNWSREWSRAR